MATILTERERAILHAIISDYITTGEPIGSRTISKHADLDLSPASIRNIMADLAEMGYLRQPHSSAGRVPTEKAFRLYVDTLVTLRRLPREERDRIRDHYLRDPFDTEDVLRQTSRLLSLMSEYVGVVLAPKFGSLALRHIHFVRLDEQQVLVVLATTAGFVQNRVIPNEDHLPQDDMDRASRYLNEEMAGLSLQEMHQRIQEQMRETKAQYDTLLARRALRLGELALAEEAAAQVYVEGTANILNQPEFADVERMKGLFRAFEEKGMILRLLDRSLGAKGHNIFIGSELQSDAIRDMTLVASQYQRHGRFRGALGVMGPTRMDYGRVIPIVDFFAELLSDILASHEHEEPRGR